MSDQPPPLPDEQPPPVPPGDRPAAERTESAVLRTTCHACGAQIAFGPGSTTLVCERCGARRDVELDEGATIAEHDYAAWEAAYAQTRVADIAGVVVRCQGCGAETESRDLASQCQFCSGNLVVLDHPAGLVEPEAVVPFVVPKAGAQAMFAEWVSTRWLAPNDLKKVGSTEALQGTYVPHWTFDADTTTDYAGQRGDYYYVTKTRTVSDGQGGHRTETYQERHTRWSHRSGRVARWFDDVLTSGSRRLDAGKLEKMGPWRLEDAAPYAPDFLAGYHALRYDVDPPDGALAARAQMERVIDGDVRRDIGGDEQRISQLNVHYAQVMFKLVLLPIWIASYVYAGKQWQVLVNANTGEVVGDRPYSWVKITLLVLLGLVVAGVIALVVLAQRSGAT